MQSYQTLTGHKIEYGIRPDVQAFINRVAAIIADKKTSEDQLVALIYSGNNPILAPGLMPNSFVVTPAVLTDPAYHVLMDLLLRKQLAETGIDPQHLADQHTLTVGETADRLGVHRSAIIQAIDARRLSAWLKDGVNYIDPRSLTTFKLSPRGPKPKKSKSSAGRASTEPLHVIAGTADGKTLRVKHPGPALATVGRNIVNGAVSPWREVAVFVGAGGKLRFYRLVPSEDAEDTIEIGKFRVTGFFRIAEKLNNAKAAQAAWKEFSAS